MPETQLTDFDEELAEELRVYDEFRDGDTVRGIVNGVGETPPEEIIVYVDLPWNEEVERRFKKPQNDPGDKFEAFVKGVGYQLNAASNIVGEEVPCKYDEFKEEWKVIVPVSKIKKSKNRMTNTVKRIGEGLRNPSDLFNFSRFLSLMFGLVLATPIITTLVWMGVILQDIEWENHPEKNSDPVVALVLGGVGWSMFNTCWYILWQLLVFNGEPFIPFIPL